MEKQIIAKLKLSFDEIAHKTEDDIEFWYARELQPILGYQRWEKFDEAIRRGIVSCETAGVCVSDHFRNVTKMVPLGS